MDCLFCKIVAGEIPAEIVYEDDKTMAFLDIHPRAPGHIMLIPKKHSENILDLPEKEIAPLFSSLKKITAAVKKAVGADGLTIGINHGRASGQEIDHLHIHIIPRFKNDGGSSLQSVVNNQSKESLEEIAQKIKNVSN